MPHASKSIETYIDEELTRVDEQHDTRLDQIKFNANGAYFDTQSTTFGMVPIAMAQEPSAFTARMLEITHKQMHSQGIQPFSVALSANYPDIDEPRYAKNRAENLETIRAFQDSAAGQQLPLSFYEQAYQPGTTIGKIRRDLAHVALHGMRAQHRNTRIPLYANVLISDVDTWYYSPAYLPRQQAALETGYSWSCANKRYLTSGGKFPNLDRAIQALNLAQVVSPRANYDCHSTYSVRTLIEGENFAADDNEYETHYMRERAEEAMGKDFVAPFPRQVPGAIAVSYPRRPFEKYRNGFAGSEFWLPGEFSMLEDYREGVSGSSDIPFGWSNHYVAERVATVVNSVRDDLVKSYHAENGDICPMSIRPHTDIHIANILRKADVLLGLQLDKLSIFDAVVNPARQN